jgi:hypothetical protein
MKDLSWKKSFTLAAILGFSILSLFPGCGDDEEAILSPPPPPNDVEDFMVI